MATYEQSAQDLKRVYYEGADQLKSGYALCYNPDYGTLTLVDKMRGVAVEKPSISNMDFLAGVVHPHSHNVTGPAWVTVIEPKGIQFVHIWTDQNAVGAVTGLAPQPGSYAMGPAGGSMTRAVALQTIDRHLVPGTAWAMLLPWGAVAADPAFGFTGTPDLIDFNVDFLGSAFTQAALPHPWTLIDTSAAGAPTIAPVADCHGGAALFTLAADIEAEAIGIDFGDQLLFDVDQLIDVAFRFRGPTLAATEEIIIGMITDQDDAPANLTEGVWLSVDGAQDIHIESDDGTAREDDADPVLVLGNDVWCDCYMDFRNKADVKVYLDVLGTGSLAPAVVAAAVFELTLYAGGLQPCAFITKSGGATTGNMALDRFRVRALRF